MASSRRSAARSAGGAAVAVENDPMALTLRRCAELSRQRRDERLLAEVAALRRQNDALQQRRAQLVRQLADTPADQQEMHASFAALGAQAVWRHLGVWAAASRPGGGGRRRTVVRLRPDDDQPAHTLQLEAERGGALTASVRDLPPGVRLDSHLKRHGTRQQAAELVHAVASEVDAFSSRRRQVAALRAALPTRRTRVWHDPALCDISLHLQLSSSGHRARTQAQLNMVYTPGAARPHQCSIVEADQLSDDDTEELGQASRAFLRLPLRQAFAEAFQ